MVGNAEAAASPGATGPSGRLPVHLPNRVLNGVMNGRARLIEAPADGIRVLDAARARALVGMEHLTRLAPELDEPLLTADQVAVLLAVPRSSVYEYARRLQRPLPSIRIGRHRRFLRSDVLAWVRALREL